VDDVIEKIQKICKQKNTRISEFMRSYDKLRHGNITSNQFLESLSMSKIYLSQKEADMLITKYHNSEKQGFVNWRKFCDDIDVVFVVKELEKKTGILDVTQITKNSFKLNELSLPDQATLQDILKEMKAFFEINRIDPKPAFTNYDKLKRGKVLKPQFKKIFDSMKLVLASSSLEILMKKYGDPISNEINYIFILNDAKEVGKEVKYHEENQNEELKKEFIPVLSNANNFYTYQTHFLEIDFNIKDVLDKIKHTVKTNRIRLEHFFVDFDPLRKGEVTKAKLRTALDMAKLNLRKEEYDLLETHFEMPGDSLRVNYKNLIEEVDTVFTIKVIIKSLF
jgi:Ca2+-binding EF-hand superfamily protein